MNILILLSIIIIIIYVIYIKRKEHFYDVIPYKYRWNMGKCWNSECLEDALIACNRWCDVNGHDEIAMKNLYRYGKYDCKYQCKRYADNQVIYNRFGYYNWMKNMKKFDGNTMINVE